MKYQALFFILLIILGTITVIAYGEESETTPDQSCDVGGSIVSLGLVMLFFFLMLVLAIGIVHSRVGGAEYRLRREIKRGREDILDELKELKEKLGADEIDEVKEKIEALKKMTDEITKKYKDVLERLGKIDKKLTILDKFLSKISDIRVVLREPEEIEEEWDDEEETDY